MDQSIKKHAHLTNGYHHEFNLKDGWRYEERGNGDLKKKSPEENLRVIILSYLPLPRGGRPGGGYPNFTEVMVSDPPTTLSLKNMDSSLLFFSPSVYNSGQ
jgi:hypothetical protein